VDRPLEAGADGGLEAFGGGCSRRRGGLLGGWCGRLGDDWLIQSLTELHEGLEGEPMRVGDELHLPRKVRDNSNGRAKQAEPPWPQSQGQGRVEVAI
jgi:hypothetical protein